MSNNNNYSVDEQHDEPHNNDELHHQSDEIIINSIDVIVDVQEDENNSHHQVEMIRSITPTMDPSARSDKENMVSCSNNNESSIHSAIQQQPTSASTLLVGNENDTKSTEPMNNPLPTSSSKSDITTNDFEMAPLHSTMSPTKITPPKSLVKQGSISSSASHQQKQSRISLDNSELHRISRIALSEIENSSLSLHQQHEGEELTNEPPFSPPTKLNYSTPQKHLSQHHPTSSILQQHNSANLQSPLNIYPSHHNNNLYSRLSALPDDHNLTTLPHNDEISLSTTSNFTTNTSATTSLANSSARSKIEDEQLLEAWRKSYKRRASRAGSICANLKTQDDLALIGLQPFPSTALPIADQWKNLPSRYYYKDEDVEGTFSTQGRVKQSRIIVSSTNKNIHVSESSLDIGSLDPCLEPVTANTNTVAMSSKDLGFSSSSDEEAHEVRRQRSENKILRKAPSRNLQIQVEKHSPLISTLQDGKSPKKITAITDVLFHDKNHPTIVYASPHSTASTSTPLPFKNDVTTTHIPSIVVDTIPDSNVKRLPRPKGRYVNHIREESLYIEDTEEVEDDYVVKQTDMEMIENTKEKPKPKQSDAYNVNDYLSMKPVKDIVNKNIVKQLKKSEDEDFSDDEDESVVTAPPTITETNGTKTDETNKKKFEIIYINDREQNRNSRKHWPSNYIRTTKYTLLTFIPKNLFEQFKKATNIYFLISVIAVLIPGVSPVFPITAIIPLVAIVLLQMIKDGIEDFQRYRQDRKANNIKCRVIRNGAVQEIKVKEVELGDIVLVSKEEAFPADLLCIHSSREDSMCYVETSNLDGETNLKTRRSLKSGKFLHDIPEYTIHKELSNIRGQLKIEVANSNLDTFEGKVKIHVKVREVRETLKESISMDNLLLRGCCLKNTKLIYGIAIYVGKNAKMIKNLKENKVKRNSLEIALNKILFFLLLLQQALCAVVAALSGLFQTNYSRHAFYLRPLDSAEASFVSVMSSWLTCFVMLNLMIPMSLVVGMEILKTFQSKKIESDPKMMYGNFKAEVKSASMNQGLSKLDVIFSDKTGTLTQNEMKYSDSWVGGLYYSEINAPGMMKEYLTKHPASNDEPLVSDTAAYHAFMLREFLLCLSLNHSVIPERDPKNHDNIVYDGPSSDEIALLECARNNGFKVLQRTNAGILLEEMGEKKFYDIMATFEFSSDRKRMSVVVKHPDGKYVCYSKGADTVMIKRSRARKHFVNDLKIALESFSMKGLRTLACSRRELSEEDFNVWFESYTKATLSTKNREKLLAHSAADMEIDLQLIGCTAIEDKLQEDVVESITFLSQAGLQIWVLTGDKTETAINVAYSTNVLQKDETIEIRIRDACNHKHVKKKMKVALEFLEKQKNKHFEYALIIDSKSLDLALEKYEKQFLRIVKFVKSAVCCRLKPLQKSRIVKLIETKLKKKALAIGDGVNDVAMIQAASIGVGIQGKEGSQASRSADYSIPRFKNLVRLIAVHGRYCCVRNADFLHLSFYKNIMIVMPQIFYTFFCGFTSAVFFESWLLTMFNTIYCFFQPLISGIYEQDLPEEVILQHPEIYDSLKRNGNLFNARSLTFWVLTAIYHASIIFFGVFVNYMYGFDILENGPSDVYHFGTIIMTATMTVITFRFALEVKTWSLPMMISIWGSYLSYFVFVVIYTPIPNFLGKGTFYSIYYHTFLSVKGTLVTLMVTGACLVPDLMFKFLRFNYFPHDYQQLLIDYKREQELEQKAHKKSAKSEKSLQTELKNAPITKESAV
ncbi:hypothetical protein C9374_007260 [Naegleria lovaniensis]|uniref:Phospholipid-transporting ATPase n=1 Tax=Naegleria lovaniensis TaxID=51637 RepID=A0AA88KSJ0_NAELO|nr:uncharacterized protein C9374_007260 [Naegleria lovaniensis]KAG2393729.1 hypothetical protein C9374_007260 [Naegleria lovaniensis]